MPTLLDRISASLSDRYLIERELGQGGMATVFLATDRRHERHVAIKVLHPELSAVLGAERFVGEIKLTASLQHPHILTLFDSGVADGLAYYVMPFVEGETLRGKLDRERQLPVSDAVRLASEIAGALQYAHERGIIHRDIKPENVLLQNGHAIVADFGIALAVQQAAGARMTQTGMSLGTPQYMAPEQAMGERNVDARADVYALGAVTYEMLAGEPPFTGPTAQAIVAKVMTERSRNLRSIRDTVPVAVEAAIATALEKLPADRQSTARAFAEDLQRTDVSALRTGSQTYLGTGITRTSPLRVAAFAAAATAVGIAIGAVAFSPRQARSVADGAPSLSFDVFPPDSVSLRLVCCGQLFTISSDGRLLVFQGTRSVAPDAKSSIGDYQLYLHDLTDMSVRELPGTTNARELFFSPDNTELGFTVGTELKRLRLTGGQPQTIATLPNGFNSGGSWYGDTIVFGVSEKMLRVPASGGTPELLFSTDSTDLQVFNPFVVEQARVLLYSVARFGQPPRVFWRSLTDKKAPARASVEGATPRYITSRKVLLVVRPNGAVVEYPFDISTGDTLGAAVQLAGNVVLRSPISTHAEYTTSETGTIVLATRRTSAANGVGVTDISGAQPTTMRVLPNRLNFLEPSFSPDSRSLALLSGNVAGESEITIIDVQRGSATSLPLSGIMGAIGFAGSRDSIMYRSGVRDIMIGPSDGSAAPHRVMQVVDWLPNDYPMTMSGPWIVFAAARNGGALADIVMAHRDSGGRVTHVAGSDRFAEGKPSVSPDGRWLAYISFETGRYRAYVTSFPNASGRHLISPNDVRDVKWSADGTTLYYAEDGKIFATALTPGAANTLPVFGAPKLLHSRDPWGAMAIAADGKHFAFVDRVREGDARSLVVKLNAMGGVRR